MVISFNDVIPFKKEMMEKHGAYVHFHDQCGAQFFNLEEHTPELQKAIEEYFAERGITAVFSGLMFRLMSSEEVKKMEAANNE